MADLSWSETTPLSRIYEAGRHGVKEGPAGVALAELTSFDLVQVMARRGRWQAAVEACRGLNGKDAPARPQALPAGEARLIWSGADQFLVLSRRGAGFEKAASAFAGVASLSEQSDARSLLEISGPRARDLLAKVCSVDLHPAAFPVGAAAATSIDHTAVNLWREDDADGGPVFHLLVFATFAESLWHTLLDSGAEYGVSIDARRAWQP
ncbi:sarcosine oxidase subunit gamma [Mesorhizobium marinum]|uniref:sarcosine oxidase subunit gamma n=1 Tax=Mesorhizobium marinum TaxID=3228790 RepID=UPI00346614BF